MKCVQPPPFRNRHTATPPWKGMCGSGSRHDCHLLRRRGRAWSRTARAAGLALPTSSRLPCAGPRRSRALLTPLEAVRPGRAAPAASAGSPTAADGPRPVADGPRPVAAAPRRLNGGPPRPTRPPAAMLPACRGARPRGNAQESGLAFSVLWALQEPPRRLGRCGPALPGAAQPRQRLPRGLRGCPGPVPVPVWGWAPPRAGGGLHASPRLPFPLWRWAVLPLLMAALPSQATTCFLHRIPAQSPLEMAQTLSFRPPLA